MELIFELLFNLLFLLVGWIIGPPCMACLQAFFALCYPAKTWQIRRLQSYVLLVTGSGLSFVFLGGFLFWFRASFYFTLTAAVVGYVLLIIGGILGRWVEEASTTKGDSSPGKFGVYGDIPKN